jgi:hypothetical protein
LTLGARLRRSDQSVWSGFRPDMSEGAWQRSPCVFRRHLNPLWPKQFLVHARNHALIFGCIRTMRREVSPLGRCPVDVGLMRRQLQLAEEAALDALPAGPFRERMWPTFSACRRKWVNYGLIVLRFHQGKSAMAPRAGFAWQQGPYSRRCSAFCRRTTNH